MSGSNNEVSNNSGPASSAEPSMEEILASIRRILKDDQAGTQPEAEEDVLVLDSTMVVKPSNGVSSPIESSVTPETVSEFSQHEPDVGAFSVEPTQVSPAFHDDPQSHLSSAANFDMPSFTTKEMEAASFELPAETAEVPNAMEEHQMSDHDQENVQPPDGLVSDAATEAAAGSIGALIRSISSDRQIAIGRPGLTLEDLVREELRPLLKAWLDTNLPALVERIVRAEIQRVIERSGV